MSITTVERKEKKNNNDQRDWHGRLILADYLHICRRSDPDIAKCIVESAYFLKDKLAQGESISFLFLKHLRRTLTFYRDLLIGNWWNSIKTTVFSLGIPEFGVAPMDPMVIDKFVPTSGNGLKIEANNLLVTGTSNFTVINFVWVIAMYVIASHERRETYTDIFYITLTENV